MAQVIYRDRKKRLTIITVGIGIILVSVLYFGFIVSCNSCAISFTQNPALVPTAEYLDQFPSPLPEFIVSLFKTPIGGGNGWQGKLEICIRIRHESFSRPGMSDDAVNEYITQHQTLVIDGVNVSAKPRVILAHQWCDGKAADTRTCGGAQSNICVDVGRAEAGLHLAEITIIDKSNQPLSYQWVFRVEKDMYKNYSTPMYLPSTPPRH